MGNDDVRKKDYASTCRYLKDIGLVGEDEAFACRPRCPDMTTRTYRESASFARNISKTGMTEPRRLEVDETIRSPQNGKSSEIFLNLDAGIVPFSTLAYPQDREHCRASASAGSLGRVNG